LNTAVEANQKVFGRVDEPKTQIALARLNPAEARSLIRACENPRSRFGSAT
jgi:hypothetical protein